MSRVKFTRHLVRFFPELSQSAAVEVEGSTVAEIITNLNVAYPGLADYIVDEHGQLRRHVNIFLGEELIQDRVHLSDPVSPTDRLYIYQALSGG